MNKIRIAATGDLHVRDDCKYMYKPAFKDLRNQADVLAIAGDLTKSGKTSEAHSLLEELNDVQVPIVAVLGNHEFHRGKQAEIKEILINGGIYLLDGDSVEFKINNLSVGFSGSKGFLSGYGKRAIPDFGEQSLRVIVDELYRETDKMRNSLKMLTSDIKILLMHYSPTKDTIAGEHPEIYPFLGSDVLARPAIEFNVDLILHGHCHRGAEKGLITNNIPVRNACVPVIKKPFTIYEVPFEK